MSEISIAQIRNFSIIAHIDHGKSTLSDCFIRHCGGLSEREMREQVLDSMDLEREKGITIKAQSVTLTHRAADGLIYELNFIDTPGHVDFSYEVSRSLKACEGALLLVDASQGVEAQTVATCYTAINHNLVVLPVLNKIDLPQSDPIRVQQEIEDVLGIDSSDAVCVSAKTGQGVAELLEALIRIIPAPQEALSKPLRALIIDSWFDVYLGVVSLVRVVEGILSVHQKIKVMSTGKEYTVSDVGVFTPKRTSRLTLRSGEVGFVVANVKDILGAPVGDTLTQAHHSALLPLDGFQTVKPQVFSGLFPIDSSEYEALRDALTKLRLNDAALFYEPESSDALGFGFRCGFLGLLHMEITQERLEREYQLDLLMTAPTVVYEILTKKGKMVRVSNPSQLPESNHIEEIREPIAQVYILTPSAYLGSVMTLCTERRGIQKKLCYLSHQVSLTYEIPMSEIVLDFFDCLKSVSRGFASLDYQFDYFQSAPLVKLDILIAHELVEALSVIVHQERAVFYGRTLVERLSTLIHRQMFEISIQAAIGSKIIARANVRALRKNVLAKCYGGDITRKRKLLEKQKAGKKRMKQIGRVAIPQEAFLAALGRKKHVDKE